MIPKSPLEDVSLPGKLLSDGTPLRYGPSDNAPTVAELPAGEVVGLQLREPLTQIDLLTEEVEIHSAPNGKTAAVMTAETAQNGFIAYMGTTLTLIFSDGRSEILVLDGDGCPRLQHGAVTYYLRTADERTKAFKNGSNASLSEILSPIFDQIKIPQA